MWQSHIQEKDNIFIWKNIELYYAEFISFFISDKYIRYLLK